MADCVCDLYGGCCDDARQREYERIFGPSVSTASANGVDYRPHLGRVGAERPEIPKEETRRMRTEDYTERTLTNAQATKARGWLEDCFGEELPANLTDLEIAELVDHHYEGGLDRFVRDAEILTRDYCPMCGEYLPLTYEFANAAETIVVCKFCATGEIPAAVVRFNVIPLDA